MLGVVQGFTEFFPVSSDGHLVMAQHILGLQLPGILFEIVVHVATLLSVIIVYHKRIWELIRGCCGLTEQSAWPYVLKIALATLPAVVFGLALKDWFEARFDDPAFAGTMLLVTGSVVWSSRWALGRRVLPLDWLPLFIAAVISLLARTLAPFLVVLAVEAVLMVIARLIAPRDVKLEPTPRDALIMGCAQVIAILPGVSRSGSTVIAGLWGRIAPLAAAEFSFLMSIPAIIGAAVLMVPDVREQGASIGVAPLAIGAVAAGISGILAIRLFVVLLRKQNFASFSYYCWIAGALFLLSLN